MTDGLIVARLNNYGIRRDCDILAAALGRDDLTFRLAHSRGRPLKDWVQARKSAERLLFVERVFPLWYSAAHVTLLVPNPERFPRRHLNRLARIDYVLAKTRHAEKVFAGLGARTFMLGFTSEDCFDASVEKDWNAFLHIAGGSTVKGTEDLLALWRAHPEWPELVLVQKEENAPQNVPANVRLLSGFISQAELRSLQNRCGIHLCPSRCEGWGHYIIEAMSAGAVVLTTDGPPMNEHITPECGILVPAARSEPRHLGTSYFVDMRALERAILGLLERPDTEKAALGTAARRRFEMIDGGFRARAQAVLQLETAGRERGAAA